MRGKLVRGLHWHDDFSDRIVARYYAADGQTYAMCSSGLFAHVEAVGWLLHNLYLYPPRLHGAKKPRSNTGYLGIHYRKKRERNGVCSEVYDVSYHIGGKRKTKSFHVSLHTSHEATLAEALQFRNEQELLRSLDKKRKLATIWETYLADSLRAVRCATEEKNHEEKQEPIITSEVQGYAAS